MSEESLPVGWIATKCSEFCSGRNKTFNPTTATESSYVLYSVPSHATGQPEIVTPKEIGSSKQYVTRGDTLISKINPHLNRTWVVGDHPKQIVIASTEWIVFAKSPAVDPGFISFYLRQSTVRDFLCHNASGIGGSLTRIKPAVFDQIPLPVPPLAEQKRIVAKIEELFSELDAGEESLRRARRQLGVYRQSLLKQAFEGKLTAPWRAQHPDASAPRETTLTELVEIKSGNGFPMQYQDGKDGDFPFFKVGDISRNAQAGRRKLGRADNYISAAILKKIRGTLIPPNATVFAKIGAAVALNRRAITSQSCLIDNNAMALVPCDKLDPDFLYLFMRQVDLGEKTRGGAVPSLRKGDIEEIPILLPSLPEQQEIVCLLGGQFEVIEQNEREIDAALKRSEALRQSILKKAFTGQLVPQDPTDEPASALLARIRKERENTLKATVPFRKRPLGKGRRRAR